MAINKTFTSAKQEFDAKFGNSNEFEGFFVDYIRDFKNSQLHKVSRLRATKKKHKIKCKF